MTEKMFDKIAPEYDFLNNIISFFMHKSVKRSAVKCLKIKPFSRILDLCTGSGDIARIVKDNCLDVEIIGADISFGMIETARRKNRDIVFLKENAEKMKFKSGIFDYVISSFGFRNIKNKNAAIKEIYRVLKPEGLFLHLDFGRKNFFDKIYNRAVLFFAFIFAKNKDAYKYLIDSKNSFFEPKELIEFFENAGFEKVCQKELCFGIIAFQIMKKQCCKRNAE